MLPPACRLPLLLCCCQLQPHHHRSPEPKQLNNKTYRLLKNLRLTKEVTRPQRCKYPVISKRIYYEGLAGFNYEETVKTIPGLVLDVKLVVPSLAKNTFLLTHYSFGFPK
jgi:hypothetical protein